MRKTRCVAWVSVLQVAPGGTLRTTCHVFVDATCYVAVYTVTIVISGDEREAGGVEAASRLDSRAVEVGRAVLLVVIKVLEFISIKIRNLDPGLTEVRDIDPVYSDSEDGR